MPSLNDPISHLPLVGSHFESKLAVLNITTIKDLLYHFPFRYDDASNINTLDSVKPGDKVTLIGEIANISTTYTRSGKTIQKAVFTDPSGSINVTWFNQPYLIKTFTNNPHVSLSGVIRTYRDQLTLTAPEFEIIRSQSQALKASIYQLPPGIHTGRLVPMYHQTAGISSKWLRSRIKAALDLVYIPEFLPEAILVKENLLELRLALRSIHFPDNLKELNRAINRLSFDELFILQIAAQIRRYKWRQNQTAHIMHIDPQEIQHFINNLPFRLTTAQHRVLNEVVTDLKSTAPMNRLLQGDVGSGKTVIAAAAAYISIKNGLPAVIMAPTEILAGQHAQSLDVFLKPHGIEISLQTRSSKAVIKPGQIIVGTHAVLHRSLPGDIGFIAIDEQHRFGVEQRARLLKRATTPHVLSMTATPIPRTIALSLYADLDISLIDEMPPGRIPVKTWVVPPSKRQNAYQWILSQVTDHHAQVFIVCPFITESENPELDQVKAAESEFEIITNQVFPHLRVGLLHGRLSAKDKAAVTNSFAHHQLDVLVSTPVVEVGVDIPAATIMFIEGAERFGLASLHQLRGRVGRSDIQSYCLLFTTGDRVPKRLKYLESINSGMKLAELDLKIRGPGELYGLKQSGYINLKLASLTDTKLIATTQHHAAGLVQHDPRLTHHPLLTQEIKTSLAKMTSPN